MANGQNAFISLQLIKPPTFYNVEFLHWHKRESYCYKTSPNIPPAMASSPKCTLYITLPHHKPLRISLQPHAHHMPRLSHPSPFFTPITNLLTYSMVQSPS